MDNRVSELEETVEELKEELRFVRSEVRRLRRLVEDRDSRESASGGSHRSSVPHQTGVTA